MIVILFLNPLAAGGAAARRWRELGPALESRTLRGGYETITDPAELRRRILGRAGDGGLVVAAGGDGTVNLVAEILMGLDDRDRRGWTLGAIGLGSSNDFHRAGGNPAAADRPAVRIDREATHARAVGRVTFVDPQGAPRRRHFLVNASVGLVALGNHLFNQGCGAARFLKPRWTAGAIACAAGRALLEARDADARITVDGSSWTARLTNAHVLLSPYVSGGLRYDFDVPAERAFRFAICEGLGRVARVGMMLALSRGRFQGRPGTRVFEGRTGRIEPEEATVLETDGEVCLARAMRFEHLAGALNVCAR